MVRNILSSMLVVLLAVPVFAATGKEVSYKSGDDTVKAILYTPNGKGPFPGIVVIHEWWGLVDWVKDEASRLSDLGYATLAIDLYRGKVATSNDEAHELMRGVPDDRAAHDLHAAVEFLKSQPAVNKDRIASIGWCMGGGYSLDVALQEPTLKAAVINYGHLAERDELQGVNAAILGIFGGQDRGISVEDVKKFEQDLKSLGKTVEIHVYPDAGHAFENPANTAGYRPADTADAWKHTEEFLARTLKQ